MAKEPAGTQISVSPFLTGLEFNECNENINKPMFLSYQPLSLFRTIATEANQEVWEFEFSAFILPKWKLVFKREAMCV